MALKHQLWSDLAAEVDITRADDSAGHPTVQWPRKTFCRWDPRQKTDWKLAGVENVLTRHAPAEHSGARAVQGASPRIRDPPLLRQKPQIRREPKLQLLPQAPPRGV